MSERLLARYKGFLEQAGLRKHASLNKLREVEDKFVTDGHAFSMNGEILYSYDVCGGCEAHALLYALRHDLASNVNTAPSLEELSSSHRDGIVDFINCP